MTLEELIAAAQTAPLSASQLGEVADYYQSYRTERLAADKAAAALKAQESAAQELLIQQMLLQKVTAAGGRLLRVTCDIHKPDYVPHVKEWDKFYQYIKQNDAFDLLERRPGKLACKERWDAGEIVPGVEKFPVYKLSTSKVK